MITLTFAFTNTQIINVKGEDSLVATLQINCNLYMNVLFMIAQ